MSVEPVCEFVKVGKEFGGRKVIADLSFHVGSGEMVAIIGRSGCGKSTALNLMGLLEQPDSGEVRLFGRPAPGLRSGAARQMLRSRLGYLFQNSALIEADLVDDNLKVAQIYSRTPRDQQAPARLSSLERVGLAEAQYRRVYELSGGEQQRLAVARLLLKPCDLVLADEPTGSLDPGNRDVVLRMLDEMRAGGKSIIVVTHDPAVAEACDRVVDLELANGANQSSTASERPASSHR